MTDVYKTKSDVLAKANEAINLPFKDFDVNNRLGSKGNKGKLGQIIEEGLFKYKINNKAEPDFPEAGVELKVTGYKKVRGGFSAKERLALNIINYMKEYENVFETSSFWKKNRCILMMFYEYVKEISKGDFTVYKNILFEYPEEDLIIIRDDWDKIITKIRKGKAHELSEGDTLYLGACPKAASKAKGMVKQPFSNEKAMQRAYSLKQSYMSHIVREYVFGDGISEKIITDPDKIRKTTFEEYIINKISKYYGKTQAELCNIFNKKKGPKHINYILVSSIFNLKDIKKAKEFQKASIFPKTISVNKFGKVKEAMSFINFKFLEIIEETWEESTLKMMFEQSKFLLVVFQDNDNNEPVLKKAMFWNLPQKDLEQVKKVWHKTVKVIKNGVEIKEIKTKKGIKRINNLPKSRDNDIAHVRPKGRKGKDMYPLPNGDKMAKQCFWLNKKYIYEQINNRL